MPDIKLYDYQRAQVPAGTKTSFYWTPPKKQGPMHYRAPWTDAPMICGFYDEHGNLLGIRFIWRDGRYEDVQ